MENSISVVICTNKEKEYSDALMTHIRETVGIENCHLFIIHNPVGFGLSEVYNNVLSREDNENNIIVFIHDDIEFLKKGWGVEILRLFNEHKDYGIIGVAGSAEFDSIGAWWNYNDKYGQVLHRHDGKSWLTTFSPLIKDDLKEVCVIDGLFIAVHKNRITKKFDENVKFDFYDVNFCLDNYFDGKTKIGVTTNIRIAHNSIGELRESWHESLKYTNNKFKDKYPIHVVDGKKKKKK